MSKQSENIKALRAAFPCTIPILAGFLFLGMTYGVLMSTQGFPFWYSTLMGIAVFAGSMQFVAVSLLTGLFNPIQAFFLTLMINARHLFYGIAMLGKYKNLGRLKPYMIYGLIDETFSINCSQEIPEDVNPKKFMFFVTLLNQIYWVGGSTLGGLFGAFLSFNTEGLDFAMTAMFVVIFLEQWLKEKNHTVSVLGLVISTASLVIFGKDGFIIPAMLVIVATLTVLRPTLTKGGDKA